MTVHHRPTDPDHQSHPNKKRSLFGLDPETVTVLLVWSFVTPAVVLWLGWWVAPVLMVFVAGLIWCSPSVREAGGHDD